MNLTELKKAIERVRRVRANEDLSAVYEGVQSFCPSSALGKYADDCEAIAIALTSTTPIRSVLEKWGFQDAIGGTFRLTMGNTLIACDDGAWFRVAFKVAEGRTTWRPCHPQPRTEGELVAMLLRLEGE